MGPLVTGIVKMVEQC